MHTKDTFAAMLDGREIDREITEDEERRAKDAGLVVLFGYSDDGAEFRGAIDDEVGCYNGGTIYVRKEGVLPPHQERCECNFCGHKAAVAQCKTITALWGAQDQSCSWAYLTTIPHAVFGIMQDGEMFCRGIVFSIADL